MSLFGLINKKSDRQLELRQQAGKAPLTQEELEELEELGSDLEDLYAVKRRARGDLPDWLIKLI